MTLNEFVLSFGVLLCWGYGWPLLKASNEGHYSLLPIRPAVAMNFAGLCAFAALSSVLISFFIEDIRFWVPIVANFLLGPFGGKIGWSRLLTTGNMGMLWLMGFIGFPAIFVSYFI